MEQAGPGRDNSPSEIVCGKGMGPGEIMGPGHERPGEDRGMTEPKSPGQKVRTTGLRTMDAECGLGLYVESKNNTSESIYETEKNSQTQETDL